jgi:hypothetical protein
MRYSLSNISVDVRSEGRLCVFEHLQCDEIDCRTAAGSVSSKVSRRGLVLTLFVLRVCILHHHEIHTALRCLNWATGVARLRRLRLSLVEVALRILRSDLLMLLMRIGTKVLVSLS